MPDPLKTCSVCKGEKPVDEYHKDKKGKYGVASRCKVCAIEIASRWQKNNKKRVNEKNLAWKRENAEKVKASAARYRAENREAVLKRQADYKNKNRELVRAKGRAYIRANLKRANEIWHRRRARLLAAKVENVSRDDVWERDGGICHICGEPCDPNDWHLDHIRPLSRGGEHSMANTAVSHPVCNLSKGNKLCVKFTKGKQTFQWSSE